MKCIVVLLFAAFALNGCQKTVPVREAEIPETVKARIKALNISTDGLLKTEDGYIAEGDIFLPNDLLNSNAQTTHYLNPREDHYRTLNLVTGLPRTLTVRYTGASANLSTAINQAIARYNAQNLLLKFQRVTTPAHITVSDVSGVAYNAVSGFPSATGNPYTSIRVNTAIFAWPVNTLATLVAHEIGHCIGFAHTDILDAFSCPPGSPIEGPGSFIHIPGTPTTGAGDPNSWMLRCIAAGVNRPFTAYDQLALNYIY